MFSPYPPDDVVWCRQVPDETAAPPAEGEKPKMKTVTKKSNVWEKVNVSKVRASTMYMYMHVHVYVVSFP
jgi:hypothetical protein